VGETKKIKRILVVDDQAVARKAISMVMSQYGHVDMAGKGEEAISMYAEAVEDDWAYDLVCMDLTMHGLLPGHRAVACIRAYEQRGRIAPAPVVIITSSDRQEDIAMALEVCGANDYVVKPFDRERVEGVARKYLVDGFTLTKEVV